jgi:hypothetical protein
VGYDPDGDRLLANVGMAGTVDQALLMRTRELLLAPPDLQHPPVQIKELSPFQGGRHHPHRPPSPLLKMRSSSGSRV